MSTSAYATALDLAVGALLLCTVLAVWRRQLAALVRVLWWQGLAVAAIPVILGIHAGDPSLVALGAAIALLRAGVLPWLIGRLIPHEQRPRESEPLLNTTASLLAAAGLTGLAYLVAEPLVSLDRSPATQAAPVALGAALIGLFLVTTRRRAVSQIVGFLMLDNGVAALAFLTTAGLPLVVEFGASTDVVLAVLILQVLTGRMRVKFGNTDVDELRELRD